MKVLAETGAQREAASGKAKALALISKAGKKVNLQGCGRAVQEGKPRGRPCLSVLWAYIGVTGGQLKGRSKTGQGDEESSEEKKGKMDKYDKMKAANIKKMQALANGKGVGSKGKSPGRLCSRSSSTLMRGHGRLVTVPSSATGCHSHPYDPCLVGVRRVSGAKKAGSSGGKGKAAAKGRQTKSGDDQSDDQDFEPSSSDTEVSGHVRVKIRQSSWRPCSSRIVGCGTGGE